MHREKGTAMIRVILWDIDGTLLNFEAAERNALRACFRKFGLGECPDDMLRRYSEINKSYWRRLEDGRLTREQVLTGRFREFFTSEGLPVPDIAALNGAYQLLLGDTVCFQDDSYNVVGRLRGRVKQYAVTNGTRAAQERKLKKSGLGELLDGVFISEDLGAEKPSPVFFQHVFRKLDPYDSGEVVIVGDSLTSDIRGGNNAGILTCWYNPERKPEPDGLRIDFNIRRLDEVETLVRFETPGFSALTRKSS